MVRFGFRVPSLKKRFPARTGIKRAVRQRTGLKLPRGWGWPTNPRKATANRVSTRKTRGCSIVEGLWAALVAVATALAAPLAT